MGLDNQFIEAYIFDFTVFLSTSGTSGTSGTGGGTGTSGTTGEWDMNIQAGKLTGVGTVGGTVTFATAFSATLAADGDYVGWAWGCSATNAKEYRTCPVSQLSGSQMVIYAPMANTVVRWLVIPRTE